MMEEDEGLVVEVLAESSENLDGGLVVVEEDGERVA